MRDVETAIIGGGAFGKAIASLLLSKNKEPVVVDIGETITNTTELVILAVPIAHLREALHANARAFGQDTIVVNCAKGIEQESCLFPHQIYRESIGTGTYAALSGPSFAKEIIDAIPTVVDVACSDFSVARSIAQLLETPYFKIETHDSVMEIELAGALKNVYAIAAGFVSGSGGGANTHAHVQVVALREYEKLARVLCGESNVIRPSIVGDLHLTTSSTMSRNYRFGFGQATGNTLIGETVEGSTTIEPLCAILKKHELQLPLAQSVYAILQHGPGARNEVFAALGF